MTPFVTSTVTFTDNVDLAPADTKQSDVIFEVRPGFTITNDSRKLKLHLTYSADLLYDTRQRDNNDVLNSLEAAGRYEAIENFLFIDFTGNISQTVVSPFGPRPPSNANFVDSRTESRSASVSPYARGRTYGGAEYEFRYTASGTWSSGDVERQTVNELEARLDGAALSPRLPWRIEAFAHRADFRVGADERDARVRGVVGYAPDPTLKIEATLGAERYDYGALYDSVTDTTYGASISWHPTERTEALARWEKRVFGDNWEVLFSHRMPRLAFTVSDRQETTNDAQRLADASTGITYELIYAALSTRIADPAERAIETQRFIDQRALPPDLHLPIDFLTPGVYVQRGQNVSMTWFNARQSFAASIYRTQRRPLASTNGVSNIGLNVDERGLSAAVSHRLDPLSAVALVCTWRETRNSDTGSDLSSRQWDARATYSTRLGRNVTGSLEARHVRGSTGGTGDYTENALVGTVGVTF